MLDIPPSQVFAVSAQKALLAKVNGDDALLARSRLPALEGALSRPAHSRQARHRRRGVARPRCARSPTACARSSTRAVGGVGEQLAELTALRGKNQDVVEHMMERVRDGEGAVRARPRALHRVAQRVHAADQRRCSTTSASRRCARTPAAHAPAIEDSPFTQGRARARWASSSRQIRGDFDGASAAGGRDPRNDARDVRALRQGARARAVRRRRRSRC